MNLLIVRGMANIIDIKSYNCQEIGLAKAFVVNGIDCDILFYGDLDKDEEICFGNNKIHIFYRTARVLFGINAIFNNVDDLVKKYDYIQLNEINQLQSVLMISKYDNCYVYHGPYSNIHDSFRHKIFNFFVFFRIKKSIEKRNKNLIVFSKSLPASKYLKKFNVFVTTLGVGLDFSNLKQIFDYTNHNPHKLLYVGKIEKRRNILFLLKLLKKIISYDDKFNLTLIGDGDCDYLKKVNVFLNKNKLQKNVVMIKKVSQENLYKYYLESGIFLFPSNYEIFGMVLLESLYYGLPIISTYNGGSSMLKKGISIKKLNVNDWLREIKVIYNNYFSFDFEAIHNYVVNEFSWNNISKKMIELLLRNKDESL